MFAKVNVKGPDAIPLYQYLTDDKHSAMISGAVAFNYVKFLIDRNGQPYERFSFITPPEKMRESIEHLLNMPIPDGRH
ncbi:hypothetical protein FBUS_06350 [Fasciolopsis buskii]|uniref:Uncharacterized protein n=1 Tax=Fasciolopsis buskii TaxID=27845 RepID=A0A8E0VRU4_9TREM|nr:hypothetical protein FBUS_06350 [Fasciolopsis buski]